MAKTKPGEYVADPSEGITRPEDLPLPKIIRRSRNYKNRPCPKCGKSAYRVKEVVRKLHDLGDVASGRPRVIHVTYSQHRCVKCGLYFNADMLDMAAPKGRYTHQVVAIAVRIVVEDGLPYQAASWHMWRDHRVFVPFATIQNWVEAAGEKSQTVGPAGARRPGTQKLQRLHRRR